MAQNLQTVSTSGDVSIFSPDATGSCVFSLDDADYLMYHQGGDSLLSLMLLPAV